MSVRVLVTAGTEADISHAHELIDEIKADAVIADKGYDSEAFVKSVKESGAEAVIPPRKGRKVQRPYDKHLYKVRHLVENAIQQLKEWRGGGSNQIRKACQFIFGNSTDSMHFLMAQDIVTTHAKG